MDLYVKKEDICILLNNMCDETLFKPNIDGFIFLNTSIQFKTDNKIPVNLIPDIIECAMREFSIYVLSHYSGFRKEN